MTILTPQGLVPWDALLPLPLNGFQGQLHVLGGKQGGWDYMFQKWSHGEKVWCPKPKLAKGAGHLKVEGAGEGTGPSPESRQSCPGLRWRLCGALGGGFQLHKRKKLY